MKLSHYGRRTFERQTRRLGSHAGQTAFPIRTSYYSHLLVVCPSVSVPSHRLAGCSTGPWGPLRSRCDRNRHCPKCQAQQRATWLENRCADLLSVPYFHVLFTLPAELAPLALQHQRAIYGALLAAAAATLKTIGADPNHLGADVGFIAVLHTWGQTLAHHPHLHCVIPGGGLSADGADWISCRNGFFLPVRVLSPLFRGKMLAALQEHFAPDHLQVPRCPV